MNNDFIDGHPRSEASQQLVSVFTALVTTKRNTFPHRKHNAPKLLRTQAVLYNNRSIHCPSSSSSSDFFGLDIITCSDVHWSAHLLVGLPGSLRPRGL
jgi:3-polyprenyl-4-hydroxybenzoate decarboxylase